MIKFILFNFNSIKFELILVKCINILNNFIHNKTIYKQNVKHFANIRKKLLTRLLIQMKFKKCESKKKKMTDSCS